MAKVVPTQFASSATMLLEQAPGISTAIRPRPGEAAPERLRVLAQKAMSHEQLRNLTHELDLPVTPDRDAFDLQVTSGREKATLLSITSTAATPDLALRLTSHVVATIRTDYETLLRSKKSTAANALQADLDSLEDRDAALLDQIAFQLQISALVPKQRRSSIERELARVDTLLASLRSAEKNGARPSELTRLDRKIEQALTVYSRSHPKVKLLLNQRAALDPPIAAQGDVAETSNLDHLVFTRKTLLDRLERLEASRTNLAALRDDRVQLANTILATKRELDRQTAAHQAAIAREMQLLSLVVPPGKPTNPELPSPLLVLLITLAASPILAGLSCLLRQRLDQRVFSPADLEKKLGITPFATLPPNASAFR